MEPEYLNALRNWGTELIQSVLHPVTVIGTPVFLLGLIVHLVSSAFRKDTFQGVRAAAGALLPLICMTFLFVFRREFINIMSPDSLWPRFVMSLIWGMIAMGTVSLVRMYDVDIPAGECVLSSTFSILVFGYVGLSDSRILVYYYGVVCGLLLYIVIFGFPGRIRSREI